MTDFEVTRSKVKVKLLVSEKKLSRRYPLFESGKTCSTEKVKREGLTVSLTPK